MNKHAVLNINMCDPHTCDPEHGICCAAKACPKGILEQEDPFDICILTSETMCVACGDCVRACPLNALSIDR